MSRITSAQPSSRTRCFCQGIHAVGSVAAIGVPGAEEFAYLLANPDGAQAAHDTIAKIRPGQQVVGGGGATGVETAAEIAEQHPDAQVALLCGDNLLGVMPARARASISRTLPRLGVQVHEHARVARVLEHAVELADGTPVPATSPYGRLPSRCRSSPRLADSPSTRSAGCASTSTCAASTTPTSSAPATRCGRRLRSAPTYG